MSTLLVVIFVFVFTRHLTYNHPAFKFCKYLSKFRIITMIYDDIVIVKKLNESNESFRFFLRESHVPKQFDNQNEQ